MHGHFRVEMGVCVWGWVCCILIATTMRERILTGWCESYPSYPTNLKVPARLSIIRACSHRRDRLSVSRAMACCWPAMLAVMVQHWWVRGFALEFIFVKWKARVRQELSRLGISQVLFFGGL